MCVCAYVHSGFSQSQASLINHVLRRLIVIGTLKGYDQLMNLVLDDVKELLRGMVPPHQHRHWSTYLSWLMRLQTMRGTSRLGRWA